MKALIALLCLLPAAAMAQDTVVTLPDNLVGFIVQTLFLVVSGVITVFLPILLNKLVKRYNLQIEREQRDALKATFTNAAGGLLQNLGERARGLKLDVHNPDIASAVARALEGAPDAIKSAGLDEREIARRILEKIPQIPSAPAAK